MMDEETAVLQPDLWWLTPPQGDLDDFIFSFGEEPGPSDR